MYFGVSSVCSHGYISISMLPPDGVNIWVKICPSHLAHDTGVPTPLTWKTQIFGRRGRRYVMMVW